MSELREYALEKCACAGTNLPRLVQPALLYLLSRESLHGYAIMQKLAESGVFQDAPPDAAGVYRLLNVMESDGSLQSDWDTSESGPARKRYKITDRGLSCLERWRKTLKGHREFIDRLIFFCQ